MTLVLEHVTHRFGATVAVDDLSLTVARGEVVCLVGPSGCGKSTTLRLAAGLEELQEGRIAIEGRTVAGEGRQLPPEARGAGMVFQDFALFPHLSVLDNVMFGMRGRDAAVRSARANALIESVGMARFAQSYPHELSGGEQQRIALARALAPKPALMLLDEPFSGLDTQLRDAVRDDTLALLAQSETATLLVTHDPQEAMRMAHRVAVMREGRLVQVGPPAEIYTAPATLFVAAFFGGLNTVGGVARAGLVKTPLGTLAVNGSVNDGPVTVAIRNEGLILGKGGAHADVRASRVLGPYSVVDLALDGGLRVTAHVPGTTPPAAGMRVAVDFDRERAFVFPRESLDR